ncbi:MAG: NADH-quinone oxidoreductase subunit J [Candidatus Eisenbacteria bacterium]
MVFFYVAALVALVSTALVVTRRSAAHAALYLIVSFLAVAMIFYLAGAPFIAALEVIIYAGAIMVLFVFFIMTLNLGSAAARRESEWLAPRSWAGPAVLALLLMLELGYLLLRTPGAPLHATTIEPGEVSVTLFGPYMLGVELSSFLLLAGLVGAYHLGSRTAQTGERGDGGAGNCEERGSSDAGTRESRGNGGAGGREEGER